MHNNQKDLDAFRRCLSYDAQQRLLGLASELGESVMQGIACALAAGESVKGTTSPNPPVGAAVLSQEGAIIGCGGTSPVGGAHAEINALAHAQGATHNATAIVTLEPCNHTGKTPPCSHALVAAGIKRVIYLSADPNPVAQGGAEYLRNHGVEVIFLDVDVVTLLPWLCSLKTGRASITLKWARTLDGFLAAVDGTSKWITGAVAREYVHEDRSHRDAIVIGTGTALVDNPRLTARRKNGSEYAHQPMRVVVGRRALPAHYHLVRDSDRVLFFDDYATALESLWELGMRDILVEGGAQLISSVLSTGEYDFIQDYCAPILLGAGKSFINQPLAQTMADCIRLEKIQTVLLGQDVMSLLRHERL
ncbi:MULTISPECIES: bifunctional diaminohydroxyphosphoribosylaminopyrimidine deaminase/5-amino-6-(5-phosphoribosylamino)uracil reductase RibD [unclassified Corynebacterium]|uniref:bifunctional diaminohydroxyphosphoribosylaminopyrimidine deaminase/5-amino-6-(5-phosphoribosylamino)uracil reductase RibD n=1 Tax=unclassified Corynebacterium TaxID=2624378 RepID=UPI0021060458|nr:bifunctional diaminohydroxyphosphoribosylaminopyrimidine deaminase/5-amino-6-(5-phosphoribosylamino)uracil reductase RibD [Corynebacterium sp. SY003]